MEEDYTLQLGQGFAEISQQEEWVLETYNASIKLLYKGVVEIMSTTTAIVGNCIKRKIFSAQLSYLC